MSKKLVFRRIRRSKGEISRGEISRWTYEMVRHYAVTKLTPLQQEVVQMVKGGYTQQSAATRLGITPRTISRWKSSSPTFRRAVDAARGVQ